MERGAFGGDPRIGMIPLAELRRAQQRPQQRATRSRTSAHLMNKAKADFVHRNQDALHSLVGSPKHGRSKRLQLRHRTDAQTTKGVAPPPMPPSPEVRRRREESSADRALVDRIFFYEQPEAGFGEQVNYNRNGSEMKQNERGAHRAGGGVLRFKPAEQRRLLETVESHGIDALHPAVQDKLAGPLEIKYRDHLLSPGLPRRPARNVDSNLRRDVGGGGVSHHHHRRYSESPNERMASSQRVKRQTRSKVGEQSPLCQQLDRRFESIVRRANISPRCVPPDLTPRRQDEKNAASPVTPSHLDRWEVDTPIRPDDLLRNGEYDGRTGSTIDEANALLRSPGFAVSRQLPTPRSTGKPITGREARLQPLLPSPERSVLLDEESDRVDTDDLHLVMQTMRNIQGLDVRFDVPLEAFASSKLRVGASVAPGGGAGPMFNAASKARRHHTRVSAAVQPFAALRVSAAQTGDDRRRRISMAYGHRIATGNPTQAATIDYLRAEGLSNSSDNNIEEFIQNETDFIRADAVLLDLMLAPAQKLVH